MINVYKIFKKQMIIKKMIIKKMVNSRSTKMKKWTWEPLQAIILKATTLKKILKSIFNNTQKKIVNKVRRQISQWWIIETPY